MAVYDKNVLDRVGKYNLSTLEIISYKQDKEESGPKTMDIKGITLTMSITEDIFSNSLVGSIMVFDTQDVRSILPLTGLERLSLKFNTPGLPGYDMTEDKRYSLSPGTETFLNRVKKFDNRISIKIYLDGELPSELRSFKNSLPWFYHFIWHVLAIPQISCLSTILAKWDDLPMLWKYGCE